MSEQKFAKVYDVALPQFNPENTEQEIAEFKRKYHLNQYNTFWGKDVEDNEVIGYYVDSLLESDHVDGVTVQIVTDDLWHKAIVLFAHLKPEYSKHIDSRRRRNMERIIELHIYYIAENMIK